MPGFHDYLRQVAMPQGEMPEDEWMEWGRRNGTLNPSNVNQINMPGVTRSGPGYDLRAPEGDVRSLGVNQWNPNSGRYLPWQPKPVEEHQFDPAWIDYLLNGPAREGETR